VNPELVTLSADVRSTNADVRWRATAALAQIAGEESESLLVSLLGDSDYRVREKSVEALLSRFGPRVASACAVALADGENAGRRGAGLSLLARAGEAGRSVLLDALQHPSADVRLAAALTLPGPHPDAQTVGALEAALRKESDPNARASLLLALGRTGRREAAAPLLVAMERGNTWVRVHALEALGELGDPETAARILPLLALEPLRRAALRALARLDSSAPAEELARRAGRGETDGPLLAALRRAAVASPPETLARMRALWPDAASVLDARVRDADAPEEERTDAAHLAARLDVPGAAPLVVLSGPYGDGYGAVRALGADRLTEALLAALQIEDPEPALALVDRARELDETSELTHLLVHTSPVVRSAALTSLAPGALSIGELLDILAEDDPETVLPAAYALSASAPGEPLERSRNRVSALLDRAVGPDGPGRAAALVAVAELQGDGIDDAIRAAMASPDPAVRRAAAAAAGARDGVGEDDLAARLLDPDAEVRAAALRAFARWGHHRAGLKTTWRDLLPFLADDAIAASAAGAAIVSLAGADRARLVEEMLAQDGPIRRAALEEIPATRDAEAAEKVAFAISHEDPETARAVLYALPLARSSIAEEALVSALSDARGDVRLAAAEIAARRPAPEAFAGPLPAALALALAEEHEAGVLPALLLAVAAAGSRECLPPLDALLARERVDAEAEDAAEALALRFPDDARSIWASASARAERRWARAISRAAARRASGS